MRQVVRTHTFISECMGLMYKVPARILADAVQQFIGLNNEILKKNYPGFRFRGEQYGAYSIGERSPQLDRSLEEQFVVVLYEYQSSKDELVPIKHFLINCLNRTTVDEDLYYLLPSDLHQFVEGYAVQTLGEPVRLDQGSLDLLKLKGQPAISKIKEVLALNMLIS